MWPFKTKVRQRRLQVRKSIPSTRASIWKRFRQAGGIGSALLGVGFFAALVLMDNLPSDPLTYRAGQYVPQDIRAGVEFRVLSQELQNELLRNAGSTAPPVFRANTPLLEEISLALKNLPEQ